MFPFLICFLTSLRLQCWKPTNISNWGGIILSSVKSGINVSGCIWTAVVLGQDILVLLSRCTPPAVVHWTLSPRLSTPFLVYSLLIFTGKRWSCRIKRVYGWPPFCASSGADVSFVHLQPCSLGTLAGTMLTVLITQIDNRHNALAWGVFGLILSSEPWILNMLPCIAVKKRKIYDMSTSACKSCFEIREQCCMGDYRVAAWQYLGLLRMISSPNRNPFAHGSELAATVVVVDSIDLGDR